MTVFEIRAERIPEQVVRGMRLGRRGVWHDSRSRAYEVYAAPESTLQSVAWLRHLPILDQGDVGSCTGNAMCGALGTGPLFDGLPVSAPHLDEAEALRLYSAAEVIDGDGPYPPQDNGSYGLSVAKAAKNAGLISGYTHCFSRAAMLTALQSGPVIIGINWYQGFDLPDSNGHVFPTGSVRGGHELECREVNMAAGLVWLDNSWSAGWGKDGRCAMSFTVLDRLLAEGGDVTVPLPLTAPPPIPVEWVHPDLTFGHDPRMIDWSVAGHAGEDAYAAQQYRMWRQSRGYA